MLVLQSSDRSKSGPKSISPLQFQSHVMPHIPPALTDWNSTPGWILAAAIRFPPLSQQSLLFATYPAEGMVTVQRIIGRRVPQRVRQGRCELVVGQRGDGVDILRGSSGPPSAAVAVYRVVRDRDVISASVKGRRHIFSPNVVTKDASRFPWRCSRWHR